MSSLSRRSVNAGLLGLAAGGVGALRAQAAAAAPSFAGKTVEVLLGSEPGGGTDGTTRLVGRFLTKYLPGMPGMRYRNMPGGHGAKALNYFMTRAKPDGLNWCGGSSAHIDPNALRRNVVQYNPTKFRYFGGTSRGGSVIVIRKDKLANLTNPKLPPVIVGVLDGNRSWDNLITWGKDVLHWNVRFVVGYSGTSVLMLAMRRGETHMMGTSNLQLLKELLATGEFVGVSQLGDARGGEIRRRSTFPDVPTFPSQMAGKTSGLQAQAFDFWIKLNQIDKWYALPPATPDAIVDAYRATWSKLARDPEFLRQAVIQFSADFEPVTGQDVSELVAVTAYPKTELVAYLDNLRIKNGLPADALTEEETSLIKR